MSTGQPKKTASWRSRVRLALNVLLALTGLAAIVALVLEYGFQGATSPIEPRYLHIIQMSICAAFVLDRLLRALLAHKMLAYLRQNWVDFALIGLAGVLLLIASQFRSDVLSAGALYVFITQAYLLLALLLRAVNVNLRFADSGIHPTWLLIGSFAFLCLAGSGLLMLPAAISPGQHRQWFYPDALFTAVSATCVTGLVVKDTGTFFTSFGQGVILGLIQIGGLGIMMFGTMLAMLVGKGFSVRTSSTLGQMLSSDHTGDMRRTLGFMAASTLLIELAGAIMLYPMFAAAPDAAGHAMTPAKAAWYAIFHSISAFCNAGFSMYGQNLMQGVGEEGARPLRDAWQTMGVIAPLIILGGLGFPVLQDCAQWIVTRWNRWANHANIAPSRLGLHSRIVLTTSAILIIIGAAGLALLEKLPKDQLVRIGKQTMGTPKPPDLNPAALRDLGGAKLAKTAVFQSVSARTAGFNTVDMAELSNAGKLWMCGLMIVGGSPASTAGGMKTATIALLILATYCLLRQRNEIEVFHRSIPMEVLRKAVAVAVLYLMLIMVVTLLMAAATHDQRFVDVFFESCSACGTVGLSTGLTPKLDVFSKYVAVGAMFLGRIGPLTLLLAIASKVRPVRYYYPSETPVIG